MVTESQPTEAISVFDMLKIGVGPSSSHTLGPWRAVQRWLAELSDSPGIDAVTEVRLDLFGSLALTGRGHATDIALCLALRGEDPERVPVDRIQDLVAEMRASRQVQLSGASAPIAFDPDADIVFHPDEKLPGHANGMRFTAHDRTGNATTSTWYSIGGGFVLRDGEQPGGDRAQPPLPYPCRSAQELEAHCVRDGLSIRDMVLANERAWRTDIEIRTDLLRIWRVMLECIHRGCHLGGMLPGGLDVRRRAAAMAASLPGGGDLDGPGADDPDRWLATVRAANRDDDFRHVLKWTSTFAMAVNEENAALGRVVTAPTNGAAGVIPAVLMHELCFGEAEPDEDRIIDFLLVAGEIGTHFKKNATISAAMGGCQAEIGVSSSMAAAALAELRGATVGQALMAAEIAMEHHLGMTCDPVAGLVQVPCIERNAMGAIKAINAAELALCSDPSEARVSLDDVIRTMWETARDMGDRYKETSRGGLAVNISVRVPEC